jgi:hypothetical protein
MAWPTGHTALARIRAGWHRFLRNHEFAAELAACPTGELQRIAQEVGLEERDLRNLRPGRADDLMPQRLRQLGLDPAFVQHAQPATYRDLQKVCATCTSWRRCAGDLSNNDVQAGMHDYCPNSPTIDALAVDRPISRRA